MPFQAEDYLIPVRDTTDPFAGIVFPKQVDSIDRDKDSPHNVRLKSAQAEVRKKRTDLLLGGLLVWLLPPGIVVGLVALGKWVRQGFQSKGTST